MQSLPSRERGLKLYVFGQKIYSFRVAPLAGAWIEIKQIRDLLLSRVCRSPRGSVD